jgi:hypothetical protein
MRGPVIAADPSVPLLKRIKAMIEKNLVESWIQKSFFK